MTGETEGQNGPTNAQPEVDSGLACLSLLAKYFEKPGDYEQLRHRHGAPSEAADDIALLRCAKELGFKASAIESQWDRPPQGRRLVHPGQGG